MDDYDEKVVTAITDVIFGWVPIGAEVMLARKIIDEAGPLIAASRQVDP